MSKNTVNLADLNLTLRTYANHGCPLFRVTKLVDGYTTPFEELTTADMRGKVGRRVESCGFGPGYEVQAVELLEVIQ